MDEQVLVQHVMSQVGAEETYPFGDDVRVYKVMGKMFALVPVDTPLSISLKCEPELAVMLRDTYEAVQPGYHLNKQHWNTVSIDGSIPDDEICEMIDNSYALVVKGLKKKDREALATMQDMD